MYDVLATINDYNLECLKVESQLNFGAFSFS